MEVFWENSFTVVESDIKSGQDFLEWEPDEWHCAVTNPPYSVSAHQHHILLAAGQAA